MQTKQCLHLQIYFLEPGSSSHNISLMSLTFVVSEKQMNLCNESSQNLIFHFLLGSCKYRLTAHDPTRDGNVVSSSRSVILPVLEAFNMIQYVITQSICQERRCCKAWWKCSFRSSRKHFVLKTCLFSKLCGFALENTQTIRRSLKFESKDVGQPSGKLAVYRRVQSDHSWIYKHVSRYMFLYVPLCFFMFLYVFSKSL